jgi:hypothetical protein
MKKTIFSNICLVVILGIFLILTGCFNKTDKENTNEIDIYLNQLETKVNEYGSPPIQRTVN